MIENKRKFKRFNMPLGIKFRPTYGAIDYGTGTVINFSHEGVGLDADDFRFFMHENLELIIESYENSSTATFIGDVMWKKQAGKRCIAGIKFIMSDNDIHNKAIDKLCGSLSITQSSEFANKLGFVKQYDESGSRCKVTFRLLKEIAKNTENVHIVGDFNNWDVSSTPMTRHENGDFVITLDLKSNREYRYRYLIDGHRWENDWYAEKFVRNDFGSKDSVVIV